MVYLSLWLFVCVCVPILLLSVEGGGVLIHTWPIRNTCHKSCGWRKMKGKVSRRKILCYKLHRASNYKLFLVSYLLLVNRLCVSGWVGSGGWFGCSVEEDGTTTNICSMFLYCYLVY